MSAALNNVTAPDDYSPAATLSCPEAVRIRLRVNNQAIFWQRGIQDPTSAAVQWPEPEEFVPPCSDSIEEVCEAIRFRAAIPAAKLPLGAKPAQVTIATRTAAELG